MFDPFTLALIGGAAGGLLNKKDPLKGALLGAGMGYGGGLLMPAAGGAAAGSAGASAAGGAAAGQAYTGTAAELAADGLGGVAPGMTPWYQQPGFGMGREITGAMKEAKPFMDAAGTATQVAGMMNKPQKPIMPSPIQTPMPNSNLGQMVSGMQQEQANKMAMEKQMRMMRRQRGLV